MQPIAPQITELVISRNDIDFSKSTINKLTKSLLKHIDIASKAICETPSALKSAIESGRVIIGGYQSNCGYRWIYINLNNYNYVIPCIVTH